MPLNLFYFLRYNSSLQHLETQHRDSTLHRAAVADATATVDTYLREMLISLS